MTTSGLPVYDAVADYGASPSNADNTEQVTNAITDAHTAGGGTVFFSQPGTYVFQGELSLRTGVALVGIAGSMTDLLYGTVLQPESTAGPFITLDPPCSIENIKFSYVQNYATPTPFPPTLFEAQNGRGSCVLRNLTLYNPWTGIVLGGLAGSATSGGHLLEDIYIDPLHQGIVVDHTDGVSRMNNIQFWDFDGQSAYSNANATCLQVYHAFSLMLSNVFAQGFHTALSLADSPDTTQGTILNSYGQISNYYTDDCGYSIAATSTYVNETGTGSPGWTISNYYMAGGQNATVGVALSPGGRSGQNFPAVQVVGGSVWGSFAEGIVSLGSSHDVFRAVQWLGYN